jgi:hypothetical protein
MFNLDLEIDPAQVDVESAIESFGLRDFNVPVNCRELEPVEKMGDWPVIRLTCEKYLPLRVIAAYYDRTYAIYSDSMVDFIVES